jgi:hypothetical protein
MYAPFVLVNVINLSSIDIGFIPVKVEAARFKQKAEK